MAPVLILDRYYLAITFLITLVYQLLGFAVAWTFQFDKITDFTGGSNFFILALVTLLLGQTFCARNLLASIFVMLWAVRLASFLLFRVLKRGSDARFDRIRHHFWKFFAFWIVQMIWERLDSVSSYDHIEFPRCLWAGIVIFSFGWSLESTADIQKYLWKSSNPPRDAVISTGLWKWSRHPPYFGEILCWWGLWVLCLSPAILPDYGLDSSARAALYASVVSPLFTMVILLFASGLPPAEKSQAIKFHILSAEEARNASASDGDPVTTGETAVATGLTTTAWDKYQAYLNSTSILLPIPPALYRPIPKIVKSTLLLDFPMYQKFGTKGDEQEARLV